MKYYLITFHRAQSYGAFLQAFALQNCSVFSQNKPTIIDYVPKRFSYHNYVCNLSGSFIKKAIKYIPNHIAKKRMHKCINQFVDKYLLITNKTYYSHQDLSSIDFGDSTLISGSDQIWDVRYDDLSSVLPYYLAFFSGKKVSYASSCGEMDFVLNKDNDSYSIIIDHLRKFKCVSVREKMHEIQLNTICPDLNVVTVLDPTFLLDANEWISFADRLSSKKLKIDYPYVLVFGLYRNKCLHKYAKMLAKKENIRIINIADMFDFISGAKNVFNVDPFILIKLISGANCVVTDSFHGCALSLNFKKELHVFMPPSSRKRIESLCMLYDISDRVVDENSNLLNERMDYNKINLLHDALKDFSLSFLKKAIND